MFLDKSVEKASDLIAQSADQALKCTQHATANTVSYIKHEPVKAMLIAAATGAALMALASLVSHSRHHS